MATGDPLLQIIDLKTWFKTDEGLVKAVDGVSFRVDHGETLAVVGESGSGKSVTSLSVMRLIPSPPGRIAGGKILFEGEDLVRKTESQMRRIRGNDISMVFQEPMTSLNPVYSVGDQIAETIVLHQNKSSRQATKLAVEMLELVGIPEPGRRRKNYPHQMSGGMRQRVMIAMALACSPKLLIADEPTTALDVTIQAQILDLMRRLQREIGMSILYITHDLGVVAELADRVVVMYAGRTVEEAGVDALYSHPKMPYTLGLLHSIPRVDKAAERQERLNVIPGNVPDPLRLPRGCSFHPRCAYATGACRKAVPPLEDSGGGHVVRCLRWREVQEAIQAPAGEHTGPGPAAAGLRTAADRSKPPGGEDLLVASGLRKHFPILGGIFSREVARVQAVQGISITIKAGEVVGLVGESGSGKTTAGRTVIRLLELASGSVTFNGIDLTRLTRGQMRKHRKEMQIIFQDPFASLNPRMTVGDIVAEGLLVHKLARGRDRQERVAYLLERVGLSREHMHRYPHEFSGGQRQRIGIARALAVEPKFIVADEPVSALDVSVQAQVINLLQDLKEEFGLTLLFIAHDLAVVEYISDRVIVMYLGKIMEIAPAKELYANPVHPYTEALLSAIPIPDPTLKRERLILQGDIPSPINPPSGCVFRTRCPLAIDECATVEPPLELVAPDHLKACIRRPG